ncbi:hypothetical protein G7085_20930 [Tessaracoccus sp. HDW20]|uniref:hypothetical protein n=1 Tax=Tessaracoccus coleopterorum TaxID=2714950 RepID=UPI0018D48020|nr:hypothetical protein [Tessaracoccus coleopterorum]NHB86148.1 hypothetical protein [Tessaracoccus coleopterorum]
MKWYTRARKFPQLIGRTPDGTRIPGGPYTYTQVAAGVGTAIVMAQTTWLWAHGSLLLNATIYIGAVIGAVIATGKLPPGMRNPLVLATGALNLLKPGYRIGGAAIPHPKPTTATTLGRSQCSKPPRLALTIPSPPATMGRATAWRCSNFNPDRYQS